MVWCEDVQRRRGAIACGDDPLQRQQRQQQQQQQQGEALRAAQIRWLEADDGGLLRLQHWPLLGGRPALICPGRGEATDKYAEVADALRTRGFDVWAVNWRGQGGSSRVGRHQRRGYIRTFDRYLRDFSAVLAHLRRTPSGDRPPLIVAHSMGAHLALRHAHDQPAQVAGLVLSAPMVALALPAPAPAVRLAAAVISALGQGERFLPGASAAVTREFVGNDLTHDRARFERYVALLDDQPGLITGGATVGWLRAALRSMATLQAPGFPERIAAPCLFLVPDEDTVVPPEAVERFAARVPGAVVARLPAARHEVFQEHDAVQAALWRQIDAFFPLLSDAASSIPAPSRGDRSAP